MSKHFLDKTGLQQIWDAIKLKFKNLADGNSIIYIDDEDKLSIKGYGDAKQGQMPVKDETNGIKWETAASTEEMEECVSRAQTYATESSNYATQSGNSAVDADTAAKQAQLINKQTMEWVNDKFWWGTETEYNALTELNEDTFYFVQI